VTDVPRSSFVVAALVCAAPLAGQSLTFYGGEIQYQLGDGGGHTSFLGGVAIAIPVLGPLRTDIALLGFDYEGASLSEGWSVEGTRIATEVGLYLEGHSGWFRPYGGFGTGFTVSHRRRNQEPVRFGRVSETAHVALGAGFAMGQEWGMRMDFRARRMRGPGATTDLTVGFSRRLGRS
jgi:hypothetical protein